MRTGVAAVLLAALALASPAAAVTPKEADRLAKRVVGADALPDAVTATREALARGGVGTKAGDAFVVRPQGKAATVFVTDLESLNLAAEARERETASRLTIGEYARMLDELGFPWKRRDAGRQMVKLLAEWVRQARRHPRDPQSFTPLFLAAMAKRQEPGVNVAKGRYAPGDLRLTLLEAELLSAAMLRFETPPRPARAYASQSNPDKACTDFKKYLEESDPLFGRGANFGTEYTAGKILDRVLGLATISGRNVRTLNDARIGKLLSERGGRISGPASIVLRIQKLFAFYSSVKLSVVPRQPAVTAHETATVHEQFGALAGFGADDLAAYKSELDKIDERSLLGQRAVRDCFAALGLPLFTNVDDLAGELDSYRVDWSFQQLRARTARVNVASTRSLGFDYPRAKLQRVSDHEARAVLAVDILPGPAGKRSTAIGVCADLDSSQAPSIKTFVAAAEGGLGILDPVSELAAGWIQAIAPPTTCTAMDVHYVDAHTFNFFVRGSQRSDWNYRFESAPTQCSDGATSTGSGTQVLEFETPSPLRVRFSRVPGRGDWQLTFDPRIAAPNDFDLAGTVDRNGTTSFTAHGRLCPQGDGGGEQPPPDCGPHPVTFRARLGVEAGALLFESHQLQPTFEQSDFGYRRCPARGLYVRQLVEALPQLDDDDIRNPDVGRFEVVGSARTREDFNRATPSGTESGAANHSIRWEAQFVRVDPPEE
jgi:hypothetical protein